MKNAQLWSLLVFGVVLGLQSQSFGKSGTSRLENELALNDAYTAPYSSSSAAVPVSAGKSLLSFEPTFGLTMSTFNGTTTGNYKFSPRAGYSAGVGVLVGRSNLQFETGLMFAERGGKESFEMGTVKWDIEYKNSFIEVPLMARYSYETSKETKLFVKAGAVVGILQGSVGNVDNAQNVSANGLYGNNAYYNYNSAYANPNGQVYNDGNTKEYFNSTDLRWAGALGGVVNITRSVAWTLQADYQSSIAKSSAAQPNGYVGVTNFDLNSVTYGLNTGIMISL